MESVLVIGATGHIGAAAVQAAQQSNCRVIALVRNATSAEKLFRHLGTQEGVVTVEADVMSETGVQSVVDRVEAGELPAFQHVYSCVGGLFGAGTLLDLSMDEVREYMRVNFEPNMIAYKATIPYLLKQKDPRASWTMCTGASGDQGLRPGPGMTQGALFSMAVAAAYETAGTNVRFNEVYLDGLVQVDVEAEKSGVLKSSEFAKSYRTILARDDIRGCRVFVQGKEDLQTIRYRSKTG
ncbi:hypothetical protein M409DRAFT_54192 [Zasmidium cellare ATCC 36951]|uniref:NAD(P)-binding domain-containing protein n=1 Tax=Zasmidium cellare ATCC 36951 TaxID=1080233 RepID=A0A6A6CQ65_ZASCE|nr:uncharacterized protein M409DRAFT_54192 [Zasmidium cellare ATCC 36951]KAF2167606.1 hypothetical protein M409DRAFT_54192 [Zasmidium cellare ATCC 36951]